ncbi:hypothetical protein [Lentzea albida]|uniref:Uncharacterized protein n=1 Tax=Lentzea albida TaxID=65499 RepID=A0A1H9RU75_9PSEU|nr:hypothetical protein [Lentzea albida]SER76266.1 hypothetical protein SAMN04488000_111291 [Lentzea albida]
MGFLLSLACVVGLFAILAAVHSLIDVLQRNNRTRSRVAAIDALERHVGKPGWRWMPDDEDVPAGRMDEAERTRHAAMAGTHGGRTVRVAVFTASMPDTIYQGVAVSRAVLPGLVLVVDVPELHGNLMLSRIPGSRRYRVLGSLEPLLSTDTGRKVFAQLTSCTSPAVDIRDGVACFTFTDVRVADRLDALIVMACEVAELLAAGRKATPLGED